MPFVEPIREKLLRDRAAQSLRDHVARVKQAKTTTYIDPAVRYRSLQAMLDQGESLSATIQQHTDAYITAAGVIADSDVDSFTRKVGLYDSLLKDWTDLVLEVSSVLSPPSNPVSPAVPASDPKPSTRKPDRPALAPALSETQWQFFSHEWTLYKKQVGLIKTEEIALELWACCSQDLREQIFNLEGRIDITTCSERELLQKICRTAVESKSKAVHRHEFSKIVQGEGQSFLQFVARLKSKSSTCQFNVECPDCQTTISYSEDMVGNQVTLGLNDPEIQQEVLAKATSFQTFDQLVEFIVALELAKRSKCDLSGRSNRVSELLAENAAIKSQYQQLRRQQQLGNQRKDDKPPDQAAQSAEKCFGCGQGLHGKNLREHLANRKTACPARNATCRKCHRQGHLSDLCRQGRSHQTQASASSTMDGEDTYFSSAASASTTQPTSFTFAVESESASVTKTPSPHLEWSTSGFTPQHPDPPPYLDVRISVCPESGITHARPCTLKAVADTGAQTCTAGFEFLDQLHISTGDLRPTSHCSVGIDRRQLAYSGCVMVSIGAGSKRSNQVVYITRGVRGLYLSKRCLEDLGVIGEEYPSPQICSSASPSSDNTPDVAPCGCPLRTKPPPKPTHLPMAPLPTNRKALEKWLLSRYARSAFNTCEHQPLPLMAGRPLDIHLKPDHQPTAYHTPIPVPHHWKSKVKDGLDRDVRIGTIEPVPQGTPVDWCSRMVVVAKHDGSPRRTVDLQKLNEATVRETHHTPPPYDQASVVPPGTRKTVLDAWNGYHSLGLSSMARDATTFITEWGRYRYLRAPQGFHASGDGYTRRFDDITVDVPRKAKCIDDTLLWDATIDAAFWHTVDYLDLCASNGIVFNPTKFQFAAEDIKFAGYQITATGMKPTTEMLESILSFPTPQNLQGLQSWFGLVGQVSYATAVAPIMQPFRDLLGKNTSWYWDSVLDDLFDQTRKAVARAVEDGVRSFVVNRPTCLSTDWSKTGLGFTLTQKHCSCPLDNAPNCCPVGWKLVSAGSRFTNQAESGYAPIEGEALAVVEGLEKCRMFVLGCPRLLIATDHKPLVKILGDKELSSIPNPRLLRLKERTLMYSFQIKHIPGARHIAPDALSRHPPSRSEESSVTLLNASLNMNDDESCIATATIAAFHSDEHDTGLRTISWSRLKQASHDDPTVRLLTAVIASGFPETIDDLQPGLKPYWNIRHELSTVSGIALLGTRVVIPTSLRGEVLDALHAAHQGVSGMRARAKATVYWPTIKNAIQQKRDICITCNRIAPSQPREPLLPSPPPDYPFQNVCADYFFYAGFQYLVYVDRYTSWLGISRSPGECTAKTLVAELRKVFANYGIPEELSTDGGPQFISYDTQQFLSRWCVRHRKSSAHYAQSNGRAELAVKTAKRLIMDHTGPMGNLNTDEFMAALLQYRNTPIQEIGASPAELLFGRQMRDIIPVQQQALQVRSEWKTILHDRERALAKRHIRNRENYDLRTHELSQLKPGDKVQLQNQAGPHSRRWEKTATVLEHDGSRKYILRMDGSGRYTERNRRFLRKISPVVADHPLPLPPTLPDTSAQSRRPETQQPPSLDGRPGQNVHSEPVTILPIPEPGDHYDDIHRVLPPAHDRLIQTSPPVKPEPIITRPSRQILDTTDAERWNF